MKYILYIASICVIFLSIAVLYVGASGYYTTPREGVSFGIAEAMGSSLVYMLICYPVWKWAFAKLFAVPKKGSAFLCYCVLILFCSCNQSVNLHTKSKQLKKSENIMADMAKSSLTGDSQILPKEKQYPTEKYGELGPLLTLIRDVVDFSNQETQKLNRATEEAHIENMLQPYSLCDSDSIQDAFTALQIFGDEIDASEHRRVQRIKEMSSEFESLVKQHYRGKKSMIQSYQHGMHKSVILMNEYYRIQRDVVVELQELMRFLMSVQGLYWEENGIVTFAEDDHLERYNAHMQRIFELAEEETLNLKNMNDKKQSVVDKWTTSCI